jgi:RNA polymerase primary sigma factor
MKNTSFSIYNHVATEPLLSREEEVMLSKRIEKGDSAARDRMIKANMRLALSVVKKYTNRGVDTDDLVQESIDPGS